MLSQMANLCDRHSVSNEVSTAVGIIRYSCVSVQVVEAKAAKWFSEHKGPGQVEVIEVTVKLRGRLTVIRERVLLWTPDQQDAPQMIALQGTSSLADVMCDLRYRKYYYELESGKGLQLHAGFKAVAQAVLLQLRPKLDISREQVRRRFKLQVLSILNNRYSQDTVWEVQRP